jgi:NAD(P)-dependent dehydrogenase (short-subunit alcohol dehydrogenase family)
MPKVALVTGANKGIGFEVARRLAGSGLIVLLGARSPKLGHEAVAKMKREKLEARFVELDLLRQETIEAAFALIEKDFRCLDILINNAGIFDSVDGPPGTATLAAARRTWETNFLGTLAVTQVLLPLLKKSKAGRIVNVSSSLGSLTHQGNAAWSYASAKFIGYSASKAALNMLTVHLAYELRDTAIKVNSANPGYTATDLNQHHGHQTVAEGSEEILRLALLPADGPTGGFFEKSGPEPW